jgi:hypothetical protein
MESTKGGRPRVTIDMLPYVALIEMFDFYLDKACIEAWHMLVHVSKMAKCGFWVTTSPKSATSLRSQNTSEGDAGCLATLAYRHRGR